MNRKGISLIELVIALGISSIVVLASVSYFGMFSEKISQSEVQSQLTDIRQEVTRTFDDQEAFQATVNHPDNALTFDCYINKSDCTGKGGAIVLVARNGVPVRGVAHPGAPSSGLTYKFQDCPSYSETTGSEACPFRYEVTWRALCPAGRGHCLDPQIELRGALKYKPGTNDPKMAALNVATYTVVSVRDERAQTLDKTCMSMGGVPSGSNCSLPFFQKCNPGEYIRGFGPDNRIICGTPAAVQCPLGQVLLGLLPDGTVQCGPGCLNSGTSNLNFGFGGQ